MPGLCSRYNLTFAVYAALHESFLGFGKNKVMTGIMVRNSLTYHNLRKNEINKNSNLKGKAYE